jgi:hypothetical protein
MTSYLDEIRSYRTELDSRAFGMAAGVVAGIVFTLCAFAVAIAPASTTAALSYMLHIDLTGLSRPLSWGGYFSGLLCVSFGVGLAFAAAGALYNRFVRRLPEVFRRDVSVGRAA